MNSSIYKYPVEQQSIISTLVAFAILIGMLAGFSLYFEESLFFALGIGPTALLCQLARHFHRFSIPWWAFWAASFSWLTFSFLNIDMFLTK